MRALRALASNMRGSSMITRGAKAAAITVRTGDAVITLERTETTGRYRIADAATGTEQTYTKLAGGVPEAVTAALRIRPVPTGGMSINFAGQFDRPYLVDDSGAAAARILGELTEVDRIFEAVREANRRRTAYAATLRTRETDLAALTERAAAFAGLPEQVRACARAGAHLNTARALQDRITRLGTALNHLDTATAALDRAQNIPRPPDPTALETVKAHLDAFTVALDTYRTASSQAHDAEQRAAGAKQQETELRRELHDTLAVAGRCPTCDREFMSPVPVSAR